MRHFLLNKQHLVKNLIYSVMAWMFITTYCVRQAMCDWLASVKVGEVSISGDATEAANQAGTVLCAAIALAGLLMIAKGYATWTTGKADENSVEETKGVRTMIVGVVMSGAASIFTWLLH